MQTIKRIGLIALTCLMSVTGSVVTHAQTNTDALQNVQQDLNQKTQQQQSVNTAIAQIQQEMQSLNTYISSNQEEMSKTQSKIQATNQLIEQKKEDIVTLEDKILARKGVMKERLIALQHDDNISLVLKIFLDAKSLDDFIQRASAVTSLFSADQDIINQQKQDLQKVQDEKKQIDQQEKVLGEEQQALAKQQADLNQNLQKRQNDLNAMQTQFSQLSQQITADQQQKAGIESQIKAEQEALQRQQAAAAAATAAAKAAASQAQAPAPAPAAAATPAPGNGQELYVNATAYSWQDSGAVTCMGYNIQQNPNMKLIAVDPSVIPLGHHVWVEGYGVAIAGDTGGAIKGNRIDILKPSSADARAYGRHTIKVVILD